MANSANMSFHQPPLMHLTTTASETTPRFMTAHTSLSSQESRRAMDTCKRPIEVAPRKGMEPPAIQTASTCYAPSIAPESHTGSMSKTAQRDTEAQTTAPQRPPLRSPWLVVLSSTLELPLLIAVLLRVATPLVDPHVSDPCLYRMCLDSIFIAATTYIASASAICRLERICHPHATEVGLGRRGEVLAIIATVVLTITFFVLQSMADESNGSELTHPSRVGPAANARFRRHRLASIRKIRQQALPGRLSLGDTMKASQREIGKR